jgi:hypothetical protein
MTQGRPTPISTFWRSRDGSPLRRGVTSRSRAPPAGSALMPVMKRQARCHVIAIGPEIEQFNWRLHIALGCARLGCGRSRHGTARAGWCRASDWGMQRCRIKTTRGLEMRRRQHELLNARLELAGTAGRQPGVAGENAGPASTRGKPNARSPANHDCQLLFALPPVILPAERLTPDCSYATEACAKGPRLSSPETSRGEANA